MYPSACECIHKIYTSNKPRVVKQNTYKKQAGIRNERRALGLGRRTEADGSAMTHGRRSLPSRGAPLRARPSRGSDTVLPETRESTLGCEISQL